MAYNHAIFLLSSTLILLSSCTPEKEIVVVSKEGIVIRSNIEDIPTLGRQTSGVKVMKLKDNDFVATCALV